MKSSIYRISLTTFLCSHWLKYFESTKVGGKLEKKGSFPFASRICFEEMGRMGMGIPRQGLESRVDHYFLISLSL